MPRRKDVAVVGHGSMGRHVAHMLTTDAALAPLVRTVTVGTSRPSAVGAPGVRTATVPQVLDDPSIDVVVVTTPSDTHEAIALEALRNGKHVLVEKPASSTPSGAERLREAARHGGRAFAVVSQHRYAPDWRRVHDLIQDGALGRVVSASVEIPLWRSDAYFASDPTRADAQLGNLAYHEVDLAVWCLGPVDRVAFCEHVRPDASRLVLSAGLVHRSGCLTTLSFSSAAFPGRTPRITFDGVCGSLVLEGDRLVLDARPPRETVADSGLYLHPDRSSASSGDWLEPYRRQVAWFLASLDEGPLPALDDSAIATIATIRSLQHRIEERD